MKFLNEINEIKNLLLLNLLLLLGMYLKFLIKIIIRIIYLKNKDSCR